MTGWANRTGRGGTGRRFPLGAWGVGLLTAAMGLLAGLLMPMAWIEEASWQLYLDQLVAAARPPLGDTARLIAALVLAAGLGIVGWLAALLLGVRASSGGIAGWFASLRQRRADDEPDAPVLRASDRHPDAPARRPFSAARDVEPLADEETLLPATGAVADDEAADELLLDAHFDEAVARTTADDPARVARWDALEQVDAADEPAAPVAAAPPVQIAQAAVVVDGAPPSPPPPLDLSVARLDELIARLEAGLGRRQVAAAGPAEAIAPDTDRGVADALPAEPVIARGDEQLTGEPGFPQDPALAAALATLRRMNRAS